MSHNSNKIFSKSECQFKLDGFERQKELVIQERKHSKFLLLYKALLRLILPDVEVHIPAEPRAIIIATGGNLGGAILTLPIFYALREAYPKVRLIAVSNTRIGKELMCLSKVADQCFSISTNSFHKWQDFKVWFATLLKLRRYKAEIIIFNHNCDLEKFLLPLRTPLRIGHTGISILNYKLPWQKEFNIPIEIDNKISWHESYKRLVAPFGIKKISQPFLNLFKDSSNVGEIFIEKYNLDLDMPPSVAIQIGVWKQQAWKQWPIEKTAQLCQYIWREHGLRPIFLGNESGEESEKYLQSSLGTDTPFISLVNKTNLAEASVVLKKCKIAICNDSGLMHLSAALNVPTLALYGMTDPFKTWCYEGAHQIVRREDCFPCYDKSQKHLIGCEHKKCIKDLEVDVVQEAFSKLIDNVCVDSTLINQFEKSDVDEHTC